MAEAQPGERSQAVARYKELLRDYIDRRPSGLRGKLALALGKHKSFISPDHQPGLRRADPGGRPRRHLRAVPSAPEERLAFMRL